MSQAIVQEIDLNDIELVTRAQQGEVEAVGKLYDRYYTPIFRYLWSHVGDCSVAEDLAGQTFLQMVRALSHYRWQEVPFHAWLYRIAHNLMVDHVRKQRAHKMSLHDLSSKGTNGLNDDETDPAQVVEQQLDAERIQRALCTLDPLQQEVVVLRFLVGLSLQETATAVNKSVPAIKSLQRRGLSALKRALVEV